MSESNLEYFCLLEALLYILICVCVCVCVFVCVDVTKCPFTLSGHMNKLHVDRLVGQIGAR